ncbi:MAG: leucyl aminopeptidase family protein [Anaerolineaceae bacterium]|nr:leucyl aminopeptidase family protein [Anaerolineaceae bacterium]
MTTTFPALEILNFQPTIPNDSYFELVIQFDQFGSTIKFKFGEINYHEIRNTKNIILHAGKKVELNLELWRKLGGFLAKSLRAHNVNSLFVGKDVIDNFERRELNTFFEGFFLGNYNFEYFKQDTKPEKINIVIDNNDDSLKSELETTQIICSVINYAREIGQMPGNIINPLSLAEICSQLAEKYLLKIQILDENELNKIGANGILSVGKGSSAKPRMIILEYEGLDKPMENPVVLVGKAITFDTGGYSIKSVDGIKGMKFDKMGGITVLGTLLAASILKIPHNVVGIICAAENMISQDAYRPDDIIRTLSGKTVEILSTDAEGRLVLADGLTYAQQKYQPKCIIDFATLTGGIITALGKIRAGLFSNNDHLSNQLFLSGENTLERLWRMPLDDDYFDFIKGDDADLKNAGGKEGHPIMGAIFLKQFIESDVPWAHIDIAGAAISPKAEHYQPKGANGFGIRMMIDYLTAL